MNGLRFIVARSQKSKRSYLIKPRPESSGKRSKIFLARSDPILRKPTLPLHMLSASQFVIAGFQVSPCFGNKQNRPMSVRKPLHPVEVYERCKLKEHYVGDECIAYRDLPKARELARAL
jgi:hypothetical protein